MIEVFVTSFDTVQPDSSIERHLDSLPLEMRISIGRYKRWQDRYRALLAKLLLRAGLEAFGFSADVMKAVEADSYGRPSISCEIDFNISHSESFVLCAITKGQRVGIDIEAIRQIDLSDFSLAFSPDQLRRICEAVDPYDAFFRSWTKKESAGKADGRGLSIPLTEIFLHNNTARIGTTTWHLINIPIHSAYSCHMATDGRIDFKITELCWQGKHLSDEHNFVRKAC